LFDINYRCKIDFMIIKLLFLIPGNAGQIYSGSSAAAAANDAVYRIQGIE